MEHRLKLDPGSEINWQRKNNLPVMVLYAINLRSDFFNKF